MRSARTRRCATSTSAKTSWAPSANGAVDALTTDGTRIYAGGAFTQINGKGHHGVVAIGTDGSLPTWSGAAWSAAIFGGAMRRADAVPRRLVKYSSIASAAPKTSMPTVIPRVPKFMYSSPGKEGEKLVPEA